MWHFTSAFTEVISNWQSSLCNITSKDTSILLIGWACRSFSMEAHRFSCAEQCPQWHTALEWTRTSSILLCQHSISLVKPWLHCPPGALSALKSFCTWPTFQFLRHHIFHLLVSEKLLNQKTVILAHWRGSSDSPSSTLVSFSPKFLEILHWWSFKAFCPFCS